MIKLNYPAVQLALDYPSIDEALAMAEIGVRAGIDIIEAGTPLIVAEGAGAIGRLAKEFPDYPILADYKTMDSGGKNVLVTQGQGGHIMTVCGGAADETVKAAVAEGQRTGIGVVVDTIGCMDQAARAKQCADWGVDLIYLHYASDSWRTDPSKDATQWIASVLEFIGQTALGAGTFGRDDAVQAVQAGVDLVAIGHPVITGDDPEGALKEYVEAVKSNYRPRSG